jgi:hypothetical protein
MCGVHPTFKSRYSLLETRQNTESKLCSLADPGARDGNARIHDRLWLATLPHPYPFCSFECPISFTTNPIALALVFVPPYSTKCAKGVAAPLWKWPTGYFSQNAKSVRSGTGLPAKVPPSVSKQRNACLALSSRLDTAFSQGCVARFN